MNISSIVHAQRYAPCVCFCGMYFNISYYQKMDHQVKLLKATVLSDPWRYTKKHSIVDKVDGNTDFTQQPNKLHFNSGKENIPPATALSIPPIPVSQHAQKAIPTAEELLLQFSFNNFSNIVLNVHLVNSNSF